MDLWKIYNARPPVKGFTQCRCPAFTSEGPSNRSWEQYEFQLSDLRTVLKNVAKEVLILSLLAVLRSSQ